MVHRLIDHSYLPLGLLASPHLDLRQVSRLHHRLATRVPSGYLRQVTKLAADWLAYLVITWLVPCWRQNFERLLAYG